MNKNTFLKLLLLVLLLSITGCVSNSIPQPVVEKTISTTSTIIDQVRDLTTIMPTSAPTVTPGLDLASIEGPVLLVQTNFDDYNYLDLQNQTLFPFNPPAPVSHLRLSTHLSPSGRQIYIPLAENSGIIVDLITNQVLHTLEFSIPSLFNPELVVAEAKPFVTDLGLTQAGLLDAITQAYQSSKQHFSWYQSDRYHLAVQDASQTSTSLYLVDHQTGTQVQLEDYPGLVEDYQISPGGTQILLKKGWVINPGASRHKNYYLIDIDEQTTQPLPLPDDFTNPALTWFSDDSIGIIHHASAFGGSGFSQLNTKNMQTKQLIDGDFSELRQFNQQLLVVQRDAEADTTTFTMFTFKGALTAAQTIDQHCFYQYALSNRLLYQCELESFLLDQTLNIEPFIDSALTLSLAPDGKAIVMINRDEHSFLLDGNLQIQYELPLEEMPLEVKWLPDSSGFLYRTRGKLFYFDLANRSSSLLIESDLLSDYINLNAVWVYLE